MIATWAAVRPGDVVLGGDGHEWYVTAQLGGTFTLLCAGAAPGGVTTRGSVPPELPVHILHLGPEHGGRELSGAVATLDAAGLGAELIREEL